MDYGSRYADRRQRMLELRLKRTYTEAMLDLRRKMQQFIQRKEKNADQLLRKVKNGEISEQAYKDWLAGQAFIGKRWQAKIDEMTEALKHVNEEALSIVRNEQFNIYSENANYEAYHLEKENIGYSFDLYDRDTVEWLVNEKPVLLRPRTINGKKDRAWNQGIIANCVSQGIIQGESMKDIANRIARDTANHDMKAMVRYARTATTYAMNAGKLDSMRRANEMGIHVQKMWVARLDSRTRDAHRELDGQIQEIDDPFDSSLGDIMEPGDPSAEPANIYNCRCGMRHFYPQYQNLENRERRAYDEYSQQYINNNGEIVEGKPQKQSYLVKNMTYREWEQSKLNEKNKKPILENITERYRNSAKPGKGKVQPLKNPSSSDYPREKEVADNIADFFGEYVKMVEQKGRETVADYQWRKRFWELKSTSKLKGADDCAKRAAYKANKIHCNVMLNVCCDEIEAAEKKLLHRIMHSCHTSVDVIILHNGKFYSAYKYNKRR